MWRRIARWMVFVGTLCAAWLVATPARADAPQCDHRGAITFAPAPQLQQVQLSIDVGETPEPCGAALLKFLAPLHGGVTWDTSAADPAMPVVPPGGDGAMTALCSYPAPELLGGASGVRGSLVRPPRA